MALECAGYVCLRPVVERRLVGTAINSEHARVVQHIRQGVVVHRLHDSAPVNGQLAVTVILGGRLEVVEGVRIRASEDIVHAGAIQVRCAGVAEVGRVTVQAPGLSELAPGHVLVKLASCASGTDSCGQFDGRESSPSVVVVAGRIHAPGVSARAIQSGEL